MKAPADKEAVILNNIDLFARLVTRRAWGWKDIDPWQMEVLKCQDRYIILNCSRQSGKSSILMVKAFHKALTEPGALNLIIAEQRQSNEDLRKCRELFNAYKSYLKEKYQGTIDLSLVSDNKTSMEFGHDSRIVALPANEKVRGFSAPTTVIIDEAAFLDDEVFVSVDPMMEVSQGQLILASTPKGTSGFFRREWDNPRYVRFEVPWQQCPRIGDESIRNKRLLYGEAYVKQEYECKFLDDIASLFSEQALLESFDSSQDVFAEEMRKIDGQLRGGAALI